MKLCGSDADVCSSALLIPAILGCGRTDPPLMTVSEFAEPAHTSLAIRNRPMFKIGSERVPMSAFENFPRITPFLWFHSNAEEAVDFYLSVFKNSRRLEEFRNPDNTSGPAGNILTIAFELDGQPFTALNGGPHFKFNESVSFVVRCDNQREVDEYWEKLSADGGEVQCG